jgi:hypothetical protein
MIKNSIFLLTLLCVFLTLFIILLLIAFPDNIVLWISAILCVGMTTHDIVICFRVMRMERETKEQE